MKGNLHNERDYFQLIQYILDCIIAGRKHADVILDESLGDWEYCVEQQCIKLGQIAFNEITPYIRSAVQQRKHTTIASPSNN